MSRRKYNDRKSVQEQKRGATLDLRGLRPSQLSTAAPWGSSGCGVNVVLMEYGRHS